MLTVEGKYIVESDASKENNQLKFFKKCKSQYIRKYRKNDDNKYKKNNSNNL